MLGLHLFETNLHRSRIFSLATCDILLWYMVIMLLIIKPEPKTLSTNKANTLVKFG